MTFTILLIGYGCILFGIVLMFLDTLSGYDLFSMKFARAFVAFPIYSGIVMVFICLGKILIENLK